MNKLSSSFRDPSGFLFESGGVLYRQINNIYRVDYELFLSSGLYAELLEKNLIVPHTEVTMPCQGQNGFKVIKPLKLPWVSYPYEWCFSQLKDAARLTLEIQKLALARGMVLKDASAYNVQFYKGAPIFIDSLSFEKYVEGSPWVAYQQFCRHFLAPLALMARTDLRLNCLSREFIDGPPLDLASALLPAKTYFDFPLLSHIHLHAKAVRRYEDPARIPRKKPQLSKFSLEALTDSLKSAVEKQTLPRVTTEWGDYYADTNYSNTAFAAKKQKVSEFVDAVRPKTLWDLGANNGEFSRIASGKKIFTIAFDCDPLAVEKNYNKVTKDHEEFLQPLLLDLTNPSPGIGWANEERNPLVGRAPVDCIMALALIHHLAISHNLPFDAVAKYFALLAPYLIIEFVPKEDLKAQILLASRKDIFTEYHQQEFEAEFSKYFTILKRSQIPESDRVLYLMHKHAHN